MNTGNNAVRWVLFNKVFLMILLLVVFFAYMDSVNLQGINSLDGVYQSEHGWSEDDNVWNVFTNTFQPMITLLWYGVLAIIAVMWFLFTKDKSESLALFVVPGILIFFGTQDLLYFVFSPQNMGVVGCWANQLQPVALMSNLFGEVCPTKTSFLASGLLGLFLAAFVLFKLKYWEPKKKRGGRKK